MQRRALSFALAIFLGGVPAHVLSAKDREPAVPELHHLYATAFADLEVTDQENGERASLKLMGADTKWRWQCLLLVLMQKGPVAKLDLEHGRIVAPPLVAQFQQGDGILQLVFLDALYRLRGSDRYAKGFELLSIREFLDDTTSQITVQCEGDQELLKRWDYLRPSYQQSHDLVDQP